MGDRATIEPSSSLPAPFSWVGSKRVVADQISALLPSSYETYYEPFAGAAAVFFALEPEVAILGDFNPDVSCALRELRDRPLELHAALLEFDSAAETYYEVRATEPESELDRAARFLYLMTHGFNGVYRQNKSGKFNVPRGRRPTAPHSADSIQQLSAALQTAQILTGSYEATVAPAAHGDIVYLDPPYPGLDDGLYGYGSFSEEDHPELLRVISSLVERGCSVAMSFPSRAPFDAMLPVVTELEMPGRVGGNGRTSGRREYLLQSLD